MYYDDDNKFVVLALLICLVMIIIGYASGTWSVKSDHISKYTVTELKQKVNNAIKQCQKELPRNKICVLKIETQIVNRME